MNTFGISGGLLLVIIGLAVIDYGLDPNVPYAYHAFYLGLAGIVMGGVIIWASSRRSQNPLLTQPYQPVSTKSLSPVESIKYRKLYEESPVMQRTVNIDGIILECNQKYAKAFGYPKNEIIGKSIYDNTNRLERILDDISDVQKLVARKMTFNKEEFSVNEFMKSVVEIASPMMKEKKIEFVHATKVKSTLKSDKNRLMQVFDNLIQ